MLYEATKGLALRLMKAPTEPPDAPAGSHDSVEIYRASPKYLTYRLLGFWFFFGLLWLAWLACLIAGLTTGEEAPLIIAGITLPILFFVQLVGYFVVRIDYDMRYYIVTDRSLRVREGAVIVKEMTITHANVQNMRVVQGPILRLFGIWNLKIDTAGGGGSKKGEMSDDSHAMEMAGIENAHEVRDHVLAHLKRHGHGTGLGDLDDAGERGSLAASTELIAVLGELRDAAAGLRAAAGRH